MTDEMLALARGNQQRAGATNVEFLKGRIESIPLPANSVDVVIIDDARAFLTETGIDVDAMAPQVEGRFASAFVRATKPAAKSCCGPECCA